MSAGDGIRCLKCGGDTKVIETRAGRGTLRRRRACLAGGCGERVTTVEMVAPVWSKKAMTTDVVAVPSEDNEEFVLAPRRLLTLLGNLIDEVRS